MDFAQKAAFYIQHSTNHCFSQFWSLTRCFKWVTAELWLHLQCHFLYLYACIQGI